MTDFVASRTMMVDTQIRPSDVTKYPVIEAMLTVPREDFVPDAWREAAYADQEIEVAPGRWMLAPRTLAKMLDALAPGPEDAVLYIGCTLGYGPALVGQMAGLVVGVEEDAEMAADAQQRMSEHGYDNVVIEAGPLAAGLPRHGPYDAILIEGAVEEVPQAIIDQLAEGGRLVCLFPDGPSIAMARLGCKIEDDMSWRDLFQAWAPVLPGFERAREFAL